MLNTHLKLIAGKTHIADIKLINLLELKSWVLLDECTSVLKEVVDEFSKLNSVLVVRARDVGIANKLIPEKNALIISSLEGLDGEKFPYTKLGIRGPIRAITEKTNNKSIGITCKDIYWNHKLDYEDYKTILGETFPIFTFYK